MPLRFALSAASDEHIAFVGSYTRTTGKGIQAWRFRPSTGDLTPLGLVAETPDPSWLIAHPTGRFLYAVNEMPLYNGLNTGAVSAFARGSAPGQLTPLNRVLSGGLNPSHLAIDPGGPMADRRELRQRDRHGGRGGGVRHQELTAASRRSRTR